MSASAGKSGDSREPVIWPVALVIVGVILLLDNFLLLEGFNASNLWPLVLVVLGAQLLIRGDILPSTAHRTFGITRGSVEAATLEISAGEIDVGIRGLQREGRLIAGQYAAQSRPYLNVDGVHAHLRMDRANTPWLSFADWQMGLSHDLPWQIYVSTHLGQVNLNLSNIIIQDVLVATGLGDIRVTCPVEAFGAIALRSALGNIYFITPPGYRVRIHVERSRMFTVHADDTRYVELEPNIFVAHDADENANPVEVDIRGTFGDVYLV